VISFRKLCVPLLLVLAAGGDKQLIELAYAFEQASAARQPPQF